jgi:hypothetical protein
LKQRNKGKRKENRDAKRSRSAKQKN